MPNLVGLRDAPSATSMNQAKVDTLVAMQMEALGLKRRDKLSTTDFKENTANYVPAVELESRRLVNNSRISKSEKKKLEGWNNAWTHLQDDGTESQKLRDVNEGIGQTHRAKLMEDDSIRMYTVESNVRAARGGRGDHNAVRSGRTKSKEERRVAFQAASHQPITRVRVPKGQRPTTQPDVPRRQPAPTMTRVSTGRCAEGNMNVPSVSVQSIKRPVFRYNRVLAAPSAFMACINVRKEQSQNEPGIKVPPCAAKTVKNDAAKRESSNSIADINMGTSLMNKKPTTPVVNAPNIEIRSVNTESAAGKPAMSVMVPPKADLMDLDIGQETLQPVIQFTAAEMKMEPDKPVIEGSSSFDQKIEALERSGVLNATQLEALKTIQAQVHARANPPTLVQEAPSHIKSELEFRRPAARTPKVTTSIARHFSKQQHAFLIGEHIHKTRYHTAASLTEEFEKLSILDKKPAEPAPTDIVNSEKSGMILDKKPAKSAETKFPGAEKSEVNPFGPTLSINKGPSLPAHLLNTTATADHGAAARAQYLYGTGTFDPVLDEQPLKDSVVPAHPPRRNKINDTGFIALAENHAVGMKD